MNSDRDSIIDEKSGWDEAAASPGDSGSSSPRLVAAVKEYLAHLERGSPIDRAEFLERHAEIRPELEKCLGSLEFIQAMAPRFSEPAIGAPSKSESAAISSLESIGDYRIVREIGRGGMGIVYEAQQLSLHRRVALKVLPFAAALDSKALARFKQESLAAAHLDHPHIVHVYSVGVDRGVHYYAMQYVAGQSLAEVIAGMRGDGVEGVEESKGLKSAIDMASGGRQPACTFSLPSVPTHTGESGMPNPASGMGNDPEATTVVGQQVFPIRSAGSTHHSADAARSPGERAASSTLAVRAAGLSTDRHSNRPAFYRAVARLAIQAAEALDFAHEHGVVHRDVKPGNLLLDSAGKLSITDFGLARLETGAELTQTGDLMGTLRYMSPEQATSARGLVDQRSDAYSLGATFYELLTLRPVFAADDRAVLLKQIAEADPVPLRKLDRRIPVELETILLKCLEKEPSRRYATAQALADDLQRFLANEPILARPPRQLKRMLKWSRRHKPIVYSAASFLILAGLLALGFVYERGERQARSTTVVSQALDAAILKRGEAQANPDDLAAWTAALAAASQAETSAAAGTVTPELRERVIRTRKELESQEVAARIRVKDAERDRKVLADFESARLAGSAVKNDKSEFDDDQTAAAYARAFRNYDIDLELLPVDDAAKRMRESKIRHELVLAAMEWALHVNGPARRKNRDIAQEAAADIPPWERPLIRALQASEAEPLEELAGALLESRGSPTALTLIGRGLKDRGEMKQAIEVLGDAQRLYPGDFWLNELLGATLHDTEPQSGRALPFLMAAVALSPDSPGAHLNLGNALQAKGQLDDAIAEFRRVLELKADYAAAHSGLGSALDDKGQLEDAISEFRRALELKSDDYLSHMRLGGALIKKSQLDDAIAEFQRALELKPNSPDAHNNLGGALLERGRLDDAIAAVQMALQLRPDDAMTHNNLGSALQAKGHLNDAIAEYYQALELKPDYAMVHSNLGNALQSIGQLDHAIAQHTRAVDLKPDSADAHTGLGAAFHAKGQLDRAIAEYQRALELKPDNARAQYKGAIRPIPRKAVENDSPQ